MYRDTDTDTPRKKCIAIPIPILLSENVSRYRYRYLKNVSRYFCDTFPKKRQKWLNVKSLKILFYLRGLKNIIAHLKRLQSLMGAKPRRNLSQKVGGGDISLFDYFRQPETISSPKIIFVLYFYRMATRHTTLFQRHQDFLVYNCKN